MKKIILAASALLFAALPASADQLPNRKAGLWEIRVSTEGSPEQVIKQCVDETTDAKLQEMGSKLGEACAKNETKKTGSGFSLESDCQFGGSRIQSKGTVTGDFSSSYSMEMSSSYEPALMGVKDGKTKIAGKHVGACAADQKPGDVIMPGGQKMNVNQLQPPAQTK